MYWRECGILPVAFIFAFVTCWVAPLLCVTEVSWSHSKHRPPWSCQYSNWNTPSSFTLSLPHQWVLRPSSYWLSPYTSRITALMLYLWHLLCNRAAFHVSRSKYVDLVSFTRCCFFFNFEIPWYIVALSLSLWRRHDTSALCAINPSR